MKFNKQITQKIPIIKLGIHRKSVMALWILLLSSLLFGIYKNFTAIDTHTIHEKEVVEKQLIDTNSVESFVENFAKVYHSWKQSDTSLDSRNEQLKQYLSEDLQTLNTDMIRNDIPTSSNVKSISFWEVVEKEDKNFQVLYSIQQTITENQTSTLVTSAFMVTVYVDKSLDMVIIQNPTISAVPKKSSYEPKPIESDGSVEATTQKEITEFLTTFFKLYPMASEKELAYYVKNDVLQTIGKNYVFVELINPIYTKEDDEVFAQVSVRYLDQATKSVQYSQFKLKLLKQDNWRITDSVSY